jgi:coenzyme F420-reducing hydrogenase beta subunit
MIDKLTKGECCGCNACGDICPKGAISFSRDNEGFLYPVIDHEKCIDCGLCEKACPSINATELKKNDFELPKCFAAVNKNLEVRFDSTSGGAFSALAKKAYKHKYYVGGAVWNEDWTVSQIITNDRHDLERLRSSKYIQSDAQGLYKKIKELLVAGEKVLICGTPCQIAALKSFLRKDYENQITVDFICQYVNSPFVWNKYIEQIEKEHNSKVVYIKDKNKELGWRKLCNKVVFENGDVRYDTARENYFRRCYMGLGVASRPACYECKFKGFPRIADITIADFWGVEKYLPKEFDGNLGTSLILCNSQKGLDYLDDEVCKSLLVTETDFKNTLGGNTALTVPYNPPVKVNREQFYNDLHNSDIKKVLEDYLLKYHVIKGPFLHKCKNIAKFFYLNYQSCRGNIFTFFKSMYMNFFCKHVKANISKGAFIVLYPHCKFTFGKNSRIVLGRLLHLGRTYKTDKKVTYIELRENALLDVKGDYAFGSGCDVQVFKDAVFTIDGGGDTNMNVEIVCGQSIHFQKYVYIGRNVIIRDTNGEHYLSRQGYKTSRPVVIGTHAWLCDRATIMPGVHVYPGGIVGANAYVTSNVEAFTMVSGNPARVVDEEVYWKS